MRAVLFLTFFFSIAEVRVRQNADVTATNDAKRNFFFMSGANQLVAGIILLHNGWSIDTSRASENLIFGHQTIVLFLGQGFFFTKTRDALAFANLQAQQTEQTRHVVIAVVAGLLAVHENFFAGPQVHLSTTGAKENPVLSLSVPVLLPVCAREG